MKIILIVGKFNGHGGVQTVHRDIFDAYKKIGNKVYRIDSLKALLKFIFRSKKNYSNSIVYFSGLSVFISPLFLRFKNHVFLAHGFYVYEGLKNNYIRYFKKIIYENMISMFLFLYRWIICVAPSPISGLVNSNILSRKMHIVPWGVSKCIKNSKIPNKKYQYHLTFLGRPNSQKLDLDSLYEILRLFKESDIVKNINNLKIAFVISNENNYFKSILENLNKKYNLNITIFVNQNENRKIKILSESLFFFNCFEWEAFGLTYLEALCMGCNILIPSTSPILPIVDIFQDSAIYKYTPPNILNSKVYKINRKLSSERISRQKIIKFRSIFNWEQTLKQIHRIIK